MIRESSLKNVARVPISSLRKAERITGLSPVRDFEPDGMPAGKGMKYSWQRISEAVLVRDDYQCRICSRSEFSGVAGKESRVHMSLEVHHIIPRSKNGSDSFENLITLCEECNVATFGNGYSGVPLKNTPTLESFADSRTIALPAFFRVPGVMERGSAYLRDYARIEGDPGERKCIEKEGSEIESSLFVLSESQYSDLVRYLEAEFGVDDYCTLVFRYGTRSLPARVFKISGRLFI